MPAGWVSQAAQGLGAVGGAIESIGANKAASSTQKANNASVAQTQAAQGSMLTQAEQVAQQPFQAYTGTLTAQPLIPQSTETLAPTRSEMRPAHGRLASVATY